MTHRDEFGYVVEVEQDATLSTCCGDPGDCAQACVARAVGGRIVPEMVRADFVAWLRSGAPTLVSEIRKARPVAALDDAEFATIVGKLRWSADGEFSATVKPEECARLLEALGLDTPSRAV